MYLDDDEDLRHELQQHQPVGLTDGDDLLDPASIQTLQRSFWSAGELQPGRRPRDLSVLVLSHRSGVVRWVRPAGPVSRRTTRTTRPPLQFASPPYFPQWTNAAWGSRSGGELPAVLSPSVHRLVAPGAAWGCSRGGDRRTPRPAHRVFPPTWSCGDCRAGESLSHPGVTARCAITPSALRQHPGRLVAVSCGPVP